MSSKVNSRCSCIYYTYTVYTAVYIGICGLTSGGGLSFGGLSSNENASVLRARSFFLVLEGVMVGGVVCFTSDSLRVRREFRLDDTAGGVRGGGGSEGVRE